MKSMKQSFYYILKFFLSPLGKLFLYGLISLAISAFILSATLCSPAIVTPAITCRAGSFSIKSKKRSCLIGFLFKHLPDFIKNPRNVAGVKRPVDVTGDCSTNITLSAYCFAKTSLIKIVLDFFAILLPYAPLLLQNDILLFPNQFWSKIPLVILLLLHHSSVQTEISADSLQLVQGSQLPCLL